ncbi:hypothetical protein ONE63_005399 [Megalurothrips usitatus]|uniref:Uncharacterized protein n=1 Tax=Megalurothrips usitatus TaxID=439358 RepID=A0AAV7XVA2_9NEOP|nr:hypothetical protein ONE63_005399 [Megalurothrips usitatus]
MCDGGHRLRVCRPPPPAADGPRPRWRGRGAAGGAACRGSRASASAPAPGRTPRPEGPHVPPRQGERRRRHAGRLAGRSRSSRPHAGAPPGRRPQSVGCAPRPHPASRRGRCPLGVLVAWRPRHPRVLTRVLTQSAKGKLSTLVRIESLGNCPELANPSNGFTSSEVFQMGKTLYGKGIFEFRHNYTRLTKAVAHIKKCVDRNDPHCEPWQNWRFGDETCNLLTMKKMIWTPLFNLIPALNCPIKAGSYRIENVTVDVEKLKVIQFPDKGFWKVSIMVDADNIAKVLCYYFEFAFVKVRV